MREIYKTTRLSVASVLFVAVIIVGLITTRRPDIEYALTPQQTIEKLKSLNNEITPLEVAKSMKVGGNQFVCIDLRSPYDFSKGNISGSVNIPANRILEKESLEFFDKNAGKTATIVLYDENQSLANGPWMILMQLGYTNVKMMQGGWDFYAKMNLESPDQNLSWQVETPKYNYAAIKASSSQSVTSGTPAEKKEVVLPEKKVKTKKVEGGC